MLGLLKKNYGLSLWIVRVIFGLTLILGQFFYIDSVMAYVSMLLGVQIPRVWWFYFIYALFATAIAELLIRLLSRAAFNLLHVYVIPFNEFVVLFMLATALKNLVAGLIKLLYLLTPVVMVFGEILIDFIVGAGVYFALYLVVKKLYLNDKTAPFVFKWGVILYMAFSFLSLFFL